ncbi:MAG: hypothetical protein H6569_11515 [Lewinellaceae bacterium]|nr:hypothetical protein [Lewinellaceae bacterium]
MTTAPQVEAAVRRLIAGGDLEQAIEFTLEELGYIDELLTIKIRFVEYKKAHLAGLIPFAEYANHLSSTTFLLLQVIKPTLN